MEIYEEEVALYAHLSGLPFQSTNCPYMHEALRSEVRDYLNELEVEASRNEERHAQLSAFRSPRSSPSPSGPGLRPLLLCGKPSSSGVCNVCRMKQLVQQHTKYSPR